MSVGKPITTVWKEEGQSRHDRLQGVQRASLVYEQRRYRREFVSRTLELGGEQNFGATGPVIVAWELA
jgi:hypothetical protein